jgi:hypothetical protein
MHAVRRLPPTVTTVCLIGGACDDVIHLPPLPHLLRFDWAGTIGDAGDNGRSHFSSLAQHCPRAHTLSLGTMNMDAKDLADAADVARLLRGALTATPFPNSVYVPVSAPPPLAFYDGLQVLSTQVTSRFTFWTLLLALPNLHTALFAGSQLATLWSGLDRCSNLPLETYKIDTKSAGEDNAGEEKSEGDGETEDENDDEDDGDDNTGDGDGEVDVDGTDDLVHEAEDDLRGGAGLSADIRDPHGVWNDREEKRVREDYKAMVIKLRQRMEARLEAIRARKSAAVTDFRQRQLTGTVLHRKLRVLDLSRSHLGDMGVLSPCEFPALRVLDLSQVTLRALDLSQVTLRSLDLSQVPMVMSETCVGRGHLKALDKFTGLEVLSLHGADIPRRRACGPSKLCACVPFPALPRLAFLDVTSIGKTTGCGLHAHTQTPFTTLYPRLRYLTGACDFDLALLAGAPSLTALSLTSLWPQSGLILSALMRRLPRLHLLLLPPNLQPALRQQLDVTAFPTLRVVDAPEPPHVPNAEHGLPNTIAPPIPALGQDCMSHLEQRAWDAGVYIPAHNPSPTA